MLLEAGIATNVQNMKVPHPRGNPRANSLFCWSTWFRLSTNVQNMKVSCHPDYRSEISATAHDTSIKLLSNFWCVRETPAF